MRPHFDAIYDLYGRIISGLAIVHMEILRNRVHRGPILSQKESTQSGNARTWEHLSRRVLARFCVVHRVPCFLARFSPLHVLQRSRSDSTTAFCSFWLVHHFARVRPQKPAALLTNLIPRKRVLRATSSLSSLPIQPNTLPGQNAGVYLIVHVNGASKVFSRRER